MDEPFFPTAILFQKVSAVAGHSVELQALNTVQSRRPPGERSSAVAEVLTISRVMATTPNQHHNVYRCQPTVRQLNTWRRAFENSVYPTAAFQSTRDAHQRSTRTPGRRPAINSRHHYTWRSPLLPSPHGELPQHGLPIFRFLEQHLRDFKP